MASLTITSISYVTIITYTGEGIITFHGTLPIIIAGVWLTWAYLCKKYCILGHNLMHLHYFYSPWGNHIVGAILQ